LGLTIDSADDGDEIYDHQGWTKLRERICELDEEIDQAHENSDIAKHESLLVEKESLVENLAKRYAPNGKLRRLGDETEKARKSVQAAIARAIDKIKEEHPTLAAHLLQNICTGSRCSYNPPSPVDWAL
jgi:hypothetical protein